METAIRQIGNSKGIIIPKEFLKTCHLEDKVFMQIEDDKLVISKALPARASWDKKFTSCDKPDKSALPNIENAFDHDEWVW
jgi:antitoxin MazE